MQPSRGKPPPPNECLVFASTLFDLHSLSRSVAPGAPCPAPRQRSNRRRQMRRHSFSPSSKFDGCNDVPEAGPRLINAELDRLTGVSHLGILDVFCTVHELGEVQRPRPESRNPPRLSRHFLFLPLTVRAECGSQSVAYRVARILH